MINLDRYGNRSQTPSGNQGTKEETQPDQPDTRGGYPGDSDRIGSFDSYGDIPIPTLRVRTMPERTTLKAFAALSKMPDEQKRDAVSGLYPSHRWDEELDVLMNWLTAAANEQGCGIDDVHLSAKRQAKGKYGANMRSWLQMLRSSK